MKNLFQTDIIPVRTLSEIFQDTPQDGMPMATESQGQTFLSPRIIGGILEGTEFRSQDSGARVEILPIADPTIGVRVYDDAGSEVFKTLVSGANVGDVVMGDYANNKYAMWDKSASSFIIKGVAITDPIITGIQAGSEIAIQNWSHNMAFSATDHDTVAWADGSLKLLDGTIFSIAAGNTGTMSAITYIYFTTSETVLQTTTTYSTALGSNKILICVAQNVASGKKAIFQVMNGKALGGAGKLWTADDIAANAVTANLVGTNEIIANTANISNGVITNAKISDLAVSKLSAGTIASKAILLTATASDCYIAGGKTDFTNTDAGFILGRDYSDANKAKFYIGDATHYLNWTGAAMNIAGVTLTASVLQTGTSGANVNIENSRLAVRDSSTEIVILEKGTYSGYIAINDSEGNNLLALQAFGTGPNFSLWCPLGDLIIQADDIYLTLGENKVFVPSTTNYVYCGTTSNAWQVVTSYAFADLCSMYDEIDDIQIIKDIKKKTGPNSKDEYGFPKMNLNSLPIFLQHHDKSSKKTFRNLGRMVDLCLGAIKQLDDKIIKLENQLNK